MEVLVLTALGVGGATVLGAVFGFMLKGFTERYGSLIMFFASGVMLASGVCGLILPSLELGGDFAPFITIPAMFLGAVILDLMEKILPEAPEFSGDDEMKRRSVFMFVFAIALHNLPEGLAAGVGFYAGDLSDALFIALGIAFQNLPEGMVLIAPMLSLGISPSRTFLYAALTGLIEVVGTFIGYFAISISTAILPFALALAGGTMIYVISEDMMRDRSGRGEKYCSYALLVGFSLMLIVSFLL